MKTEEQKTVFYLLDNIDTLIMLYTKVKWTDDEYRYATLIERLIDTIEVLVKEDITSEMVILITEAIATGRALSEKAQGLKQKIESE